MKTSTHIGLIALFILLISCGQSKHRLKMVDSDIVVSRHGVMSYGFQPQPGKKVVTFYALGNFIAEMQYTPTGKIDRIIRSYPNWRFVFYVDGSLDDTTSVRKALDKYNCNYEVVLDYNKRFREENALGKLTSIGYICNGNDEVLSLALIGTDRSFFDQEFRKYNR